MGLPGQGENTDSDAKLSRELNIYTLEYMNLSCSSALTSQHPHNGPGVHYKQTNFVRRKGMTRNLGKWHTVYQLFVPSIRLLKNRQIKKNYFLQTQREKYPLLPLGNTTIFCTI